jgi:hypothetical protein
MFALATVMSSASSESTEKEEKHDYVKNNEKEQHENRALCELAEQLYLEDCDISGHSQFCAKSAPKMLYYLQKAKDLFSNDHTVSD